VRVNPITIRDFRSEWRDAEHIGKSADEIIARWNEAHSDDPIES
jgi:hypothetical protein